MTQEIRDVIDTGTGYGRKDNAHDPLLTEVGPGTPMGELLRRYWHPIAISEEVLSEAPQRVRVLGENLVLFRDGEGRVGLLRENCCHRGSSLFYGRIENDGLRCCYHGWKFDVKGNCLDQAGEAGGGARRNAARQPWYPLQERYGAVWAYMGPPEKKPALPRWDVLEGLEDGEFYEHSTYPGYGPKEAVDFNWLQSYDNVLDPIHAVWLHLKHAENHFGAKRAWNAEADTHDLMKDMSWQESPLGVQYVRRQKASGSQTYRFCVENILPNVSCVPNYIDQTRNVRQDQIMWHVPLDDTHFRIFMIGRVKEAGDLKNRIQLLNGKKWEDCTPEDLRVCPSDYEAQKSQGDITIHADETLALSDRGVVLVRRRLRQMITDMQAGKDPLNVHFDENGPPRRVTAGAGLVADEAA